MKNVPDADFLIFDLGNVIIDIDYHHSMNLIKSLVPNHLHEKVNHFYLTDFHKEYEKGKINSEEFRENVRIYFEQNWEDQKVDELWNSLLGNIPSARLDLVRKLKNNYQVGILSNTNQIHIEAVNRMLHADFSLSSFHELFDHVFYSHEMGLSKPSEEIYSTMLKHLNTTSDRVIFFDDLEANVHGAKSIGINAVHVTGPQTLVEFFGNV
jgi:glucose-1-phosphatase